MKPVGQRAGDRQPESIEFVPKRELDRVQQENDRLRKEIERLKQETERLRRELEAALRASKRQAAPHSRGTPKANPQRPGRKPGGRYGRQACRPIPARVDERIAVPLPERCPHCGGGVESGKLRNTVSGRDCPANRSAPFRYRGGPVPRVPAAGAGTPSVADLGCGGSRQRAVGAGGADPGGHPEQADGAVAGAHAASPVLWIRAGGQSRRVVPGTGADGGPRGADL